MVMSICISGVYLLVFLVFFFKQKTAYEMRISDWSSDVCSSDLGSAITLAPDLPSRSSPSPRRAGGSMETALPRPAVTSGVTLSGSTNHSTPPSACSSAQDNGSGECTTSPPRTFSSQAMESRSEEHTSELQSLMRISYAVFCL